MSKLNHSSLKTRKAYEQERREAHQNASLSAISYKMPFGPYAGYQLPSIPFHYLNHIRKHIQSQALLIKVSDEIERRQRIKSLTRK